MKQLIKELPPGKISYSPMERKLFQYLVRNKRLTSTALLERFYKDTIDQHFHARETVNAALSSLKRKLDFNKAPFALNNSPLAGPRPKEWWLEKKS
jgi:hypothetical protein